MADEEGNGAPKAPELKPGSEYPGWSPSATMPVCAKCGIGRHHCSTAGCECPVCDH